MAESPEQESRPIDAVPLLAWLESESRRADWHMRQELDRHPDQARYWQGECNMADRVHEEVERMAG